MLVRVSEGSTVCPSTLGAQLSTFKVFLSGHKTEESALKTS